MTAFDVMVETTRRDVEAHKQDPEYMKQLEELLSQALDKPTREFRRLPRGNTIIAEVKLHSPLTGDLTRPGDTPASIAKSYEEGGAADISVVTNERHFKGHIDVLAEVKEAVELPVMRKDFIVDFMQIQEARALGADGVLLMASALEQELKGFVEFARSLELWALVEAHTREELEAAVESGGELLGVNTRDFETFYTDLPTAVYLSPQVPDDRIFVVESGIETAEDIRYLRENCPRLPDAYLVGTTLMQAEDRVKKTRELVGGHA